VLIVGFIVKISAVLLDLVDAKLRRINLLCPQVVFFKRASNLAELLARSGLDLESLHVGALDDMVPLRIRLALVLLGRDAEGEPLECVGHDELDLVPKRLDI
jgi:hypothetical protein